MAFVRAKELVRQRLVYDHIERGKDLMAKGDKDLAMAAFHSALHLDPDNQFAQQALAQVVTKPTRTPIQAEVVQSKVIRVQPKTSREDFHFRGDSRELLTEIGRKFGLTTIIDDSVVSRRVRFELAGVDFGTAIQTAGSVTKTFWAPLDEKSIIFLADTAENRRQFDRMGMRTFLVSGASTPQELNDIVNVLRSLFEIKFIAPRPSANLITVRAPQRILDVATEFLQGLDTTTPQVMLDIKIYEITGNFSRNLGIQVPTQFQMFNITAGALTLAGGQSIQDLVNQLIASGGINQSNTTAISALLAQLQGQQGSIFSQPLATFGGGKTLFGVTLGSLSAQLTANQSSVQSLESASLLAAQGKDTNFRLGSRYPIINATFAPSFNSSAISQALGGGSFQAPIPSVSYEDLGLTLKAKPQIHSSNDVSLTLEMQLRSLGGTTVNGVPLINTREYKGSITVKDGEPAVVATSITRSDLRSLSGLPILASIPLLNQIVTTNSKQADTDELLVVVIPHVTNEVNTSDSEIWLSPATK
jgi:hypothetical protein